LYPRGAPNPDIPGLGTHRAAQADQLVWAGALPLAAEPLGQIARRYLAPRLSGSSKALIENEFADRAGHLGPMARGIRNLVAVPLSGAEHPRGMLLGINKRGDGFDSGDMKLIGSVGAQAAGFLENHHLYEDLQDLLMGVLHALTSSIDAKDPYTCGHSRRVALISRKLAELCGFDAKRSGRVYLAGLLHDIGKIGMAETLLRKEGRLTDDEYTSVKQHPEVSAKILSGIRQMEDLIPAILHHHERFDGRGYPAGLAGQAFPIEARIMGLADSFDAMTSYRTYRAAMPLEAVKVEIRRCSGTQFDARLVELLLSLDLEAFLTQLREQSGGEGGPQTRSLARDPQARTIGLGGPTHIRCYRSLALAASSAAYGTQEKRRSANRRSSRCRSRRARGPAIRSPPPGWAPRSAAAALQAEGGG